MIKVCEDKNESGIFHQASFALRLVEGALSWTCHLLLIFKSINCLALAGVADLLKRYGLQ
jgi:hypothetical protein